MSYIYYCPLCGNEIEKTIPNCWSCKRNIASIQSRNERIYYMQKAQVKYGNITRGYDILFEEEIQHNPQFDRSAYESRINKISKFEHDKALDNAIKTMTSEKNKNLPKCPTCSSTNIKPVSGLKRGLHGYLFGIFSATSLAQFECKDCGYKW